MNFVTSVTKVFDTTNGSAYNATSQEYNLLLVKAKINYLSDVLKCSGILFLNDAYLEMGFPLTREGQLYGWLDDEIGLSVEWRPDKYSNAVEVTFTNLRIILNELPSE